MAGSNRLFDDLAAEVTRSPRERARGVGLLDQRGSELSDLTSGAIEDRMHRWVDPACCRMWPRHNRRYDLLTQARCQDLIDGFRAQGRQEFPAIVRKVDGDRRYQYEVVCGARRHWTVTWLRENNYPEFRFLIEVRDLTDEQAFRLSDIENRDNLDLSDYERAVDYKDALGRYYQSQKEMAARLEVSEAWLSRYLDLASLPPEIVRAFGDVTEIRVKHGRDLKPYLRDTQTRSRIVARARALRTEGQKAGGAQPPSGANVVKELLAAAVAKRQRSTRAPVAAYQTDAGKLMVAVDKRGRAGLVLRVARDSGATKDELLEACRTAIDSYL